jgi:hypothetical protein
MPPNKVVRKAAAARTPGTKAKQNFADDDIFMMISFCIRVTVRRDLCSRTSTSERVMVIVIANAKYANSYYLS